MATKYLGEKFDIHTGGEDHIQIHHTNEIAQSECALGVKPWVKYWMHGAFLTFSGEKMSKSSGKIATLSDLKEQGYSAMDYRYFILTGNYRKQLNFTKNNLDNAKNSYERLKNIIKEIPKEKGVNEKYIKEFEKAINNDLELVDDRESARKSKDWKKADELRDKVKELGYQINDTKDGVEVLKL
jgi:cysteinyl-tRNA synthetase